MIIIAVCRLVRCFSAGECLHVPPLLSPSSSASCMLAITALNRLNCPFALTAKIFLRLSRTYNISTYMTPQPARPYVWSTLGPHLVHVCSRTERCSVGHPAANDLGNGYSWPMNYHWYHNDSLLINHVQVGEQTEQQELPCREICH